MTSEELRRAWQLEQDQAKVGDWYRAQAPHALRALQQVLAQAILEGEFPPGLRPQDIALICQLANLKLVELDLAP